MLSRAGTPFGAAQIARIVARVPALVIVNNREGIMAKHTMGPWTIEHPMGPDIISIVSRGDKPVYEWRHVAQIAGEPDDENDIQRGEAAANARLIAQAPNMFSVLKYLSECEGFEADWPNVSRRSKRFWRACD